MCPVTGEAAQASVHIFEGWEKLTWQERRERRISRWLAPAGVAFADESVQADYAERVRITVEALKLHRPARVAVSIPMGFYAARYSGLTAFEAMYDCEKLAAAYVKFHEDFRPDFIAESISSGPVFDLLGAKMVKWPGHGVGDDSSWQYVEGEYMKAGDYDELITDPSAFVMRKLLPRFASAFAGLAKLDPFSDFNEPSSLALNILPFADAEVFESMKDLHEAAKASLVSIEAYTGMCFEVMSRFGMPVFWDAMVKAPYDILADTLRGTTGIVMDRYRRPGKIVEATERLVPLVIGYCLRQMATIDCPLVSFPLHKGGDGFMSDADFRTYYWPTLKAVVKAVIDEGGVPVMFAEGGYNRRLEAIVDEDIPAGSVIWWFDQTDMRAAHQALKGYACIAGNVPGALLALGTAKEVETYVTQLMDSVAHNGGFILGAGTVLDDAKPENVRAMIDAGRRWAG
jgi:hypothetical protein